MMARHSKDISIRLRQCLFVGIVILNALFLIYWGSLAFYSRLHYDDLHFLWKLREMSIIDFIKEMYFTRSGRFIGYGINGLMASVTNAVGFHQLWAILYYILGIIICILSVRDVSVPLSRIEKAALICLLYNIYILTNIDFPLFFWLCAMTYYLLFPVTCLALNYLNKSHLDWKEWLCLIIASLFLGGVNESFTPMFLLLAFFCGLYWWKSRNWDVKRTWSVPQVKRIIGIAAFTLLILVIVIIAPGNYARMSDTTQFIHPGNLVGWGHAIIEAMVMFCYYAAFYLPYYAVLFLISYSIGGRVQIRDYVNKTKITLLLVAGFVLYLMISCLPNVYLYNGFGIQRTYTHVVFVLIITICIIGYVLGLGRKDATTIKGALTGVVLLIIICLVNIRIDVPTARNYAKAVDERVELLRSLRNSGQLETVTVQPLPIPYTEDAKHLLLHTIGKSSPKTVLYYISDTDLEPNEYEYHMRKLYNLPFDFVLEQNNSGQ